MTKYLLPCPHCAAEMPIDVGQAGQTVPCNHCDKRVEVPTMRGIRQLARAGGSEAAGESAPSWSPRQGLLFATGLPLMIAAIGVAAYLLWWRSTIDTSPPIDLLRMQEETDIDGKSPEEILGFWRAACDYKLQRVEQPRHELARAFAARLFTFALLSLGVAAVGLSSIVAAFVLRPASTSAPPGKSD